MSLEEEEDKEIIRLPNHPSWTMFAQDFNCYESRLKVLSQETTLVLSNTRELYRVPNTK